MLKSKYRHRDRINFRRMAVLKILKCIFLINLRRFLRIKK